MSERTGRHPHARRLIGLAAAIAIVAVVILASWPGDAQEPELLRPEAAFPYELTATGDRLRLDFMLPDGYYLYRERFGFATDTAGVTLDEPAFPVGELHSDEFFGEQEVYRHDFRIEIPYSGDPGPGVIDLQIRLQGCADIGLCYPPQRWSRSVELPSGATATAAAIPTVGGAAPGGIVGQIFGTGAPGNALLPPEEAFDPNPRFDRADELTIAWQIAPGYYLYRDKFEIEIDGDVELGSMRLPDGVDHYDENFGDVEVLYGLAEIIVPFSRATPAEIPVTIRAAYQGCKEDSVCYPPDTRTMSLAVPPVSDFPADTAALVPPPGGPSAAGEAAAGTAEADDDFVSEQDWFGNLIANGSWPALLGLFYVAGLGLSFTPCVLPMVPILSSIIVGQGAVSTARGFTLSLSYVLGMAVTYTIAGAVTALAGSQVQAMFQEPWIIASFAGLFVILALGMFGLFELQMPAAVQTRLTALANRQRGGTFAGTAVIGALTALVVTSCVAPPLIAALTKIAESGDVNRGASALFALSIGMGTPLLIFGASAGTLLPKVGPWMNVVKAGFGVMLVGVAIYMLERILPGSVALALWALLVFLTGVFLGAFEPLPESPPPARRLAKGIGVLACLYGALMLIGSMLGGHDPLQPLPTGALMSATRSETEAEGGLQFQHVETVTQLDGLLADARAASQPVMIDFTADWCVSCREMEAYTFPDRAVVAALEPFMLLRADVTENNDDDQALLRRFSSFGPPTIAFFDASGREREAYKLVGYVRADDFVTHVERLAAL